MAGVMVSIAAFQAVDPGSILTKNEITTAYANHYTIRPVMVPSPINSVGRVTGSSPASRGFEPRIGLLFASALNLCANSLLMSKKAALAGN